MRKAQLIAVIALAGLLYCVQPALADDISASIGTQHFTNGTTITTTAFLTAVSGQPSPFGAFCGSDAFSNCSTNWTFHYPMPGGPITFATLTLGIFDIDSAAPGNQVASFTLDGSAILTPLLNSVSEGLNGGTGAPNSQYDVLTISIPNTDFFLLGTGSATFALALQGPGLGVLGTTPFNGAGLDFATLHIVTPEPSTITLLGAGLLTLAMFILRK